MLETTVRVFPVPLGMAVAAGFAQVLLVLVVLRVAAKTVFGRLLEQHTLVAFLAINFFVLA